jgi:hypothetical protein
MKTAANIFAFIFALAVWTSCVSEEVIEVNPDFVLSFETDGQTTALAGTEFYVNLSGSGEFRTLYDGTEKHVWGEEDALGVPFDKATSLPVNYARAGKYSLTVVASSSEDFGKKLNRQVKTVEITAIDRRNSITNFYIPNSSGREEYDGAISDEAIDIQILEIVDRTNLKPVFILDSPDAKAYVNGVEQVSGESVHDFTNPVIYTVKAVEGNERNYTVTFTVIPSSAENSILSFKLADYNSGAGYTSSNGEVGEIDETNRVITVTLDPTTRASVQLVITSSPNSSIRINNQLYSERTRYALRTITGIMVTAENGDVATYTLNIQ